MVMDNKINESTIFGNLGPNADLIGGLKNYFSI